MSQDAVAPKKKHPGGRPSKYKPKYCQEIIDCGKRGDTLVHFANSILVTKQTLHEWASVHPEFYDALSISKSLNEEYWLNLAKNRGNGITNGSDTIIKYMLSASHGYREKTDVVSNVTADVTSKSTVDISFVDLKP